MKNKHLVLALLIQFSLAGISQNDEPALPQVFPVSPEAASLGKYGEVPVNLATGRINYTVPLYTIKVGDFEWPVYLSYNYSGLQVEEDPGIVGLGWDFMASGRISREIRGIPDERDVGNYKANTVVPYLKGDYNNLSNFEQIKYNIYNSIANLNYDGQFDKYVVSAGDVNGSFVFNENGVPVFLTQRNYVATINSIIDDRGIKYYFDEIENGEYSIRSNGDVAEIVVPVSYLLTKIELPDNGGDILFQYEAFNASTDEFYKTVWNDSEITGLENKIVHTPSENLVQYRRLKKIIFPNGEVNFIISSNTETYTNQHGVNTKMNHVLEEVSVSSNGASILKYNFVYNNTSKSKKLLKEIVKSNNGIILPFFKFNYNNESFLTSHQFDYTTQDSWGYYNGLSAPNLVQATREIDPVKTKYGALEQITYPTGGSTSIAYEQNLIFSDDPNTTVQCSYTHNSNNTQTIVPDSPNVEKVIDQTIDVGHSQIVRIRITAAVKKGTTSNALGSWANISVTANNASEYCGQSTISNFSLYADAENCASYPDPNDCWGDLILTKEIVGYAGDGLIHITGSVLELANKEAYIEYDIDYEAATTNADKMIGGIRVSSTTDCDNLGNCYTNNYSYTSKTGSSSGVILGGTPIYNYSTYHVAEPTQGGPQTGTRTYRTAKSRVPFTSYQGAPVLYERVVIEKNDGTNGKTINTYSKGPSNVNPGYPFMSPKNFDWQKGKIVANDIFSKNNGATKIIQRNTSNYSNFYPYGSGLNSTQKVYGMAVGRTAWYYTSQGGIIDGDPDHYAEDYDYEYPKENKQTESRLKDFIDNGSEIETTTTYAYDAPYTQLVEKIVTRSGVDSIKQKIYYPYTPGAAAGANASLIQQNKISIPVKNETYHVLTNGLETLLSSQLSFYKDWGNNVVFPEYIRTSKGTNTLENRIQYHSYYANGNVKEVSKINGPHVVYIWGYQEKYPIAKIENATFTEIPTATYNDIISKSNADDSLADENLLRTSLNALRNVTALSDALITTYTYDPLIGVTSITDPKGYTIYYEYDDFGRLIQVKDAAGKILSDNTYHYKDQ